MLLIFSERELDFMNITHSKFTTISARIFRVYGRGSRDVISRWIRMALNGNKLVVFQKKIYLIIYSQGMLL